MTECESKQLREKLDRFEKLTNALSIQCDALNCIEQDDPSGTRGQSPFTGNTRESRKVSKITIQFTSTRGGAKEVIEAISGLDIEAFEFGRFLAEKTRENISAIESEIASL